MTLLLPFKSQWFVSSGGDTAELNGHHNNRAQKFAFDFIIVDSKNKSFKNSGNENKDYYCFGKEIFSPANGEVVQVVNGIEDNEPGFMNGYFYPGNCIAIMHDKNLFSFLAHFKLDSIKVRVGQKVKQGDLLGLCGNSGNSSEPHLHFHLQNKPNILFASGVKCFFSNINVNDKLKKRYSPVRNDLVENS